jgi:protein-S-isoprenylcysteine O-methyltransferase Ste14
MAICGNRSPDMADTAGVIARPPLLFLGALILGIVADRLLPLGYPFPGGAPLRWTAAIVLVLSGVGVVTAGIRNFSRAATPVPTTEPTRALVTTGIHSWSRNPIYVGLFLIYAGLAVGAHSVWALILAVPLALTMRYGVVAREEAYLERLFGAPYLAYKARVRRWL